MTGNSTHRPASGTARCAAVFLLLILALAAAVSAGEAVAPEYKVKAGFIYHFAKLTEWPATAFATTNAPLIIGVLGRDPFGSFLAQAVAGKQINTRPIKLVRFDHVKELGPCHLLFIGEREQEHLPQILARLEGRSVLTVGETPSFAESGGMIAMVGQERIRLRVNRAAVGRERLRLSSQLLQLAELVPPKPPAEDG